MSQYVTILTQTHDSVGDDIEEVIECEDLQPSRISEHFSSIITRLRVTHASIARLQVTHVSSGHSLKTW